MYIYIYELNSLDVINWILWIGVSFRSKFYELRMIVLFHILYTILYISSKFYSIHNSVYHGDTIFPAEWRRTNPTEATLSNWARVVRLATWSSLAMKNHCQKGDSECKNS